MKRLFIIAMTTLAASSSFAVSDTLNCTGTKNAIYVNTYPYNDVGGESLQMLVHTLSPDSSIYVNVRTEEHGLLWSTKVFYGTTYDGRAVTLTVRGNKKATLCIDGIADEPLKCLEPSIIKF